MTTPRAPRRASAKAQCASPLCRAELDPDSDGVLVLSQRQDGTAHRWHLCDTGHLRQYIDLCDVKARAADEVRA